MMQFIDRLNAAKALVNADGTWWVCGFRRESLVALAGADGEEFSFPFTLVRLGRRGRVRVTDEYGTSTDVELSDLRRRAAPQREVFRAAARALWGRTVARYEAECGSWYGDRMRPTCAELQRLEVAQRMLARFS